MIFAGTRSSPTRAGTTDNTYGGRTVNLRDLQCMVFQAGASALMVGNYLTTLNQPVEKDLQMLRDLGLDSDWEDFTDEEVGCGEKESCATNEVVTA